MGDMVLLVFLILVVCSGPIAYIYIFYIRPHLKKADMTKELESKGYKYCGTISSGVDVGASISMSPDGDVLLVCSNKTYPIEINELSRVSNNTRLVELELSYSITDGSYGDRIFSGRIKGSEDELRTYQSRLGWTS